MLPWVCMSKRFRQVVCGFQERRERVSTFLFMWDSFIVKKCSAIVFKPQMPKTTVKNLVLLYFAKSFCKFLIEKLADRVPKKKHNKLLIYNKPFNSLHYTYIILLLKTFYTKASAI